MVNNNHQESREVQYLEQNRSINALYGHIVDVLSLDEQDYYIVLVAPEDADLPVDTMSHYIPLDESVNQLAANYGPPRDLIGLRVRVEYYGSKWRTGVARVVPEKSRMPPGNASEMPSRGFRFAVAGGGVI